jgi:hypothetical protein
MAKINDEIKEKLHDILLDLGFEHLDNDTYKYYKYIKIDMRKTNLKIFILSKTSNNESKMFKIYSNPIKITKIEVVKRYLYNKIEKYNMENK